MEWILLVGASFNVIGGVALALPLFITPPSWITAVPPVGGICPRDYPLYRLFAVGTAFSFGALYGYLYMHPEYVVPFLYFGMVLKYWAFLSSLFAVRRYNVPMDAFIGFGCANGCVALLFTAYVVFR
ncbi:MAG TPA: hypothetical protein PKM65_19520 [Spirochaetota bacterium]|nr:hypothetical protein [Spirochaetota bacterium]HNT12980.1 hypothetical protein [Spirochaetota bacterium]